MLRPIILIIKASGWRVLLGLVVKLYLLLILVVAIAVLLLLGLSVCFEDGSCWFIVSHKMQILADFDILLL